MPAITSYPKGFNENQRKAYKELTDDYYDELVKLYGTVMHQEDFREYHKCGKVTAQKILKDIPYQSAGKYKKYRTLEIARMLSRSQVGCNIKNFDEITDAHTVSLSVPGLVLNWFAIVCKKLKMNKNEVGETSKLIADYLNSYSAK